MDKQQLLQKINRLFQEKNWQQMEKICTEGLVYFPDSASTYYNRAIARAKLEKFAQAKLDLEKSLELKPGQKEVALFLKKIQKMFTKFQTDPSLLFEKENIELKQKLQEEVTSSNKISRYEIKEELGRGGMGCVYKVFDPQMNTFIALKTILNSVGEKDKKRFVREAKAMAKINHPNIVRIYDIGEDNEFITMDYIEGQDLRKYLQNASLNVRFFCNLMVKISNAIEYAHNKGIIHRDLKPGNILIDKNNEPQVTDFGLAKLTQAGTSLSNKGDILGTPRYMSPEQAKGEQVNHLTDVYALGAIFYEMLAAKPLITGDYIAEIINKVVYGKPQLLRHVNDKLSIDLENICCKASHKDIEKRYGSAGAFADDINRFLNGEFIKAKAPGMPERIWRKLKRNKLIVVIVFISVLTPTVGTWLFENIEIHTDLSKINRIEVLADKENSITKKIIALIKVKNHLEKTLGKFPNIATIKKKLFKVQKQIGELAKEQENYLLSYILFSQCRRLYSTQGQELLDKLSAHKNSLKNAHKNYVKKIMKKVTKEASQNKVIDWYVSQIVKRKKSYSVELLIPYLKSNSKMQKKLAIKVLGKLGDTYTKHNGKDSTEWLMELLNNYKNPKTIKNSEEEVIELIVALGWLRDHRATTLVGTIRNLVGESSTLWSKTEIAYSRIPLKDKRSAKNFIELYNRGTIKFSKKLYLEAIADFNDAIKLKPHFLAYNNRGLCYSNLKEYSKAIADFNQVIRLNSRYPKAYYNRGEAYFKLKDYAKALADFTQAIKSNPQNIGAYNNRGNIYSYLKDYSRALADYTQAIKINPKFLEGYDNRGSVYSYLKDYPRAIADFNQALKLNPEYSLAYYNRGLVRSYQSKHIKAIADYTLALKFNPKNLGAYNNRGLAHYSLKEYSKAIADFSENLKFNPRDLGSCYHRGLSYLALRDYSKAIIDFSQALKLNPRFSELYYRRGAAYLQLRQYQKAFHNFQTFLKFSPFHPMAAHIRAQINLLKKRNLIK